MYPCPGKQVKEKNWDEFKNLVLRLVPFTKHKKHMYEILTGTQRSTVWLELVSFIKENFFDKNPEIVCARGKISK